MPGHRKFRDIARGVIDDPAGQAEMDANRRAIRDALALGALRELREQQGVTQTELAAVLGTTQTNVSRIEHERDTYVSTLSEYVAALGGRLELRAIFDDGVVELMPRTTEGHFESVGTTR